VNLLGAFLGRLETRERRVAIIDAKGRSASFGELAASSAALAAAWRQRGLVPGDRVLVAVPLSIEIYVSLLALWRLGAVAVFPEPSLGLRGVVHAARVTKPKALLTAGRYRALRYAVPQLWRIPLSLGTGEHSDGPDAVAPVDAEHPALISFTSGSTGLPKTIVRSHAMLGRQNAYVADLLAPKHDGEIDLIAFPVFVLANLGMGTTSVLPNWDLRQHDTADPARIAALIAQRNITRALVPPSICEKLYQGAQGPRLNAIFTGGGPVFPRLLERMAEGLPTTDIVTVYGSTEAEPIAHVRAAEITAADWTAMRNGAGLLAGTPIRAAKVDIRNDEIIVTGDHVNKGYLEPKDDRTTKLTIDGQIWHRTGDAGRIDSSARLWLLGRTDGAIGQLFPFCVEAAAQYWTGVVRCALIGIDERPILAIEGAAQHLDEWKSNAQQFGDIKIVPVATIPLDRRHRSKVNYPELRKHIGAQI
jgi:acyl-coenzyme A synthetase/AMP-(fatty) acid ligase